MITLRCLLLRRSFEGAQPRAPDVAEWPPSWMRLFSALVAVAEHADPAEEALLRTLERAGAPEIHASDRLRPQPRTAFVPTNRVEKGTHSTLLGRTSGKRRWARAIPRSPAIWYRWPQLDLDRAQSERLARMCRRIPYLGRSTSPVIVEPSDSGPDGSEPWRTPDVSAIAPEWTVRCPFPGSLDALRDAHAAKERGEAGDPWEIGCDVGYVRPGATSEVRRPADRGPYRAMVILALDRPLDGRHTARLTYHTRRAVLARAERHLATLHGHHGGDAAQCVFLGLPHVGAQHADGHLLGVAVAIPDLPPDELEVVARALPAVGEELQVMAGTLGAVSLSRIPPLDAQRRAWALRPERWTEPARTWCTALPMVFDRYLKRKDDSEAAARRTVVNSGYPAPQHIVLARRPLAPGALDLAPQDTIRRPGEKGFKPYRHAILRFPDPVEGPVVVGSMRHYGLGLCFPMSDDARN